MVGLRTLTPSVEVRILFPQPFNSESYVYVALFPATWNHYGIQIVLGI